MGHLQDRKQHLLEFGVFCVLDQLQQDALGGGEISAALLQSRQSEETVRLTAERGHESGNSDVPTHTKTQIHM